MISYHVIGDFELIIFETYVIPEKVQRKKYK